LDYYIVISDGNSNDIVDCFIQRLMDPLGNGAPAHGGHGYHIQADTDDGEASQDNWILSCTARRIDEPFSLRGTVRYNEIIEGDSDIRISELHKEEGTVYAQGCISIVGGPEDNNFSQTVLRNSKAAIAFFSLSDYDEYAPTSGTRNTFENCLIENCKEAIRLSWWNEGDMQKLVSYNKFINCNFIGEYGSILFLANRVSYGNQVINCIITGFSGYVSGVPGQTLYPLNGVS
jgi:hypothetical protein